MSDQWTAELSAYLDGDLDTRDRDAFEAHLVGCVDCRNVLAELRRVADRARSLPDRAPARDLWPGIAAAIGVTGPGTRVRAPRVSFTVPQLLAASVALMIGSGAVAWLAKSRDTAIPVPGVSWAGNPQYTTAVRQLEQAIRADAATGRLDSATVRVVVQNLAVIDTALAQARRALAADPASAYLNRHVADTMERKLELLRATAALGNART